MDPCPNDHQHDLTVVNPLRLLDDSRARRSFSDLLAVDGIVIASSVAFSMIFFSLALSIGCLV